MTTTDPSGASLRAEGGEGARRLDEGSAEWLRQLRSTGADRDAALQRLHELMLRAGRREAGRRSSYAVVTGPELDDLAHQAASDAMLAVLARLDDFRGESRFTTWAYKFVMFEVSTKLGRHFWRTSGMHLDESGWERIPDRLGVAPDKVAEGRELVVALRQAIDQVLTAHQRRVFVALVVDGAPVEALAAELGSNRNAIYKTMFDARRKIRSVLVANGHLAEEASRGV